MASKKTLYLIGFAVLGVVLGLTLARIKSRNVMHGSSVTLSGKTSSSRTIQSSEIKLLFLGDIMLGRSVMQTSLQKNDYNYPFEKSAEFLRNEDLVFANLENTVISDCPLTGSGFKLCAKPEMLGGLNFANVGVVNVANNHTGDYGPDGLKETLNNLDKYGVSYAGTGNLTIKEIRGIKIGFLGFNYVFKNTPDSDYEIIKESKAKVDFLVVALHWGLEYTSEPTASQEAIARKIIESGADFITGSHPHWVQKVASIDSKPVYYSLGNFVFDQMWSEETKTGMAVEITLDDGKITNVKNINTYMSSFAQPQFLDN